LGETASNQSCGNALVPAKLIHTWLTIDLAVIFVSLVIIRRRDRPLAARLPESATDAVGAPREGVEFLRHLSRLWRQTMVWGGMFQTCQNPKPNVPA